MTFLHLVYDDLILAFSKLDVQATMFLSRRTLHTDMDRLASIKLANAPWYVEADKTLTSLLGRAFNFFRTKTDPLRFARDDETPVSLYTDLQDLEDELRRFREEHSLSGVPHAHSVPALPHAHQILWLNSLMLHILLSCCLCMDEMVYDFFLADFEAIIAMVEGMVYTAEAATAARTLSSPAGGFKDFHLNMSLLFPIFKTAMLCRSPSLRRRCMALMVDVSFDEGVWQGDSGYKYAEIFIRLEEEGLVLDDCASGTAEALGPEVIVEEQRLRSLDVQPEGAERNSTLFFRFNKETAQWDDLVKAVVW
ncbi:hypothetical protein NQ176_g11328 [Zarea fungicola]|uniref:Uncharacterized protein n=1 Tax=Zarea fungicola TaxID=93591 RepID=A0ACC1MD21_9HYPO|nr:hypothetical protein NQ176_g11328 [Lecanicillium fungicola]